MTDLERSREEVEYRLEMLRQYEHVSFSDHQRNRACIRQLEWVLYLDEEEDDEVDLGVAATGFVCQNLPEHPGDEPVMVSAGPSPGVICPKCGRMANGPDDEIPYGDPPEYK